ncbi:MAG: NADH-dependent alcohol dehydrogenase [Deltaproteobacteria bacterium HGW-Deltaproteobacteria-10]|nr:MAG: NADH-dependent alcohol dehydrogenase [Deltaproteobacteria bacterium HGW-Deltaproteobacteria-10]
MQNFVFDNPTKIIFGKGQISKTGKEVSRFGRKVLLVCGRESIKKNGIYDQVMSSLRKEDLSIVEFPGVKSNPMLAHARKGIDLAREAQADVVLAVGGGSVIDTAKTIAAGVPADHDVWDFFTYKKPVLGALPLLTVLTLAASASEMNSAAVITREEGLQKFSFRSPYIQPRVSILDPTALYSLPASYSAYSGVDAISHLLETYFNNEETDSPFQDRLVECFLRTIMESTDIILREPTNYNARANMMWATTWAFNGLPAAGLGRVTLPVHMIEHSLSAIYDIAHGAGLAIVLPGWMLYTLNRNQRKLAQLAREIFHIDGSEERAAVEGIGKMKEWFAAIGCPVSLQDVGIPANDIDKIAENAFTLAQAWQLTEYTREVIADILRLCR